MINNIYCVGRNYRAHAEELGNKVEAEPVIFSKPNTSICKGNLVNLPAFSKEIHFETEIVLRISKECYLIDEIQASKSYDAIALGLDLTARDLQTELKNKKLPWLLSKGFKDSAYISDFIDRDLFKDQLTFEMKLNGEPKQIGNTEDMIFNFSEIISFISRYIKLYPGDVIFTGTPEGVGKLKPNDSIKLILDGQFVYEVNVL